jgi:hypothetical protein
MSQRAVEMALGKLVTNEEFRDQFFSNPGLAILRIGLNLSPGELDALLENGETGAS